MIAHFYLANFRDNHAVCLLRICYSLDLMCAFSHIVQLFWWHTFYRCSYPSFLPADRPSSKQNSACPLESRTGFASLELARLYSCWNGTKFAPHKYWDSKNYPLCLFRMHCIAIYWPARVIPGEKAIQAYSLPCSYAFNNSRFCVATKWTRPRHQGEQCNRNNWLCVIGGMRLPLKFFDIDVGETAIDFRKALAHSGLIKELR